MMIERVGKQFDNYHLIRLLGYGGFADVYLGIHLGRNTLVAVKVLHHPLNQEDLPTFLEEVRNLLRLRHPYIVPLLDFSHQHVPPFIIMDYAPNGTLRQRHPAGATLPPQTIVTYINQVAVALQYAHDEKIIHRDVKPQNMLLGANNEVLLSDFGIATVAHNMHSINTNKQVVAGTPTYMAPEQFLGKACPASDQYALGVVVYEWLCGRPPFEGTFYTLYQQHLNNAPQPLHERVPAIPPTVEQVVLQALAKKPEERHSNLTAFAEALEQAVRFSHQPIQILPTAQSQPGPAIQQPGPPAGPPAQRPQAVLQQPSPPHQFRGEGVTQALEELSLQPLRNDQSRNLTPPSGSLIQAPPAPSNLTQPEKTIGKGTLSRRTVLTVAAAAILAGGTGVVSLITHQQSPHESLPPRQMVTSQTTRTTPAPTGPSQNQPSRTTPTPTGPSQNQPSRTTSTPTGPSQNQPFTYRGHSDVIEAVAWSPDGQRIASTSVDRTVQVWNASDGSHLFTYTGHSGEVHSLAWSPDGQRIASGSDDKTVQVWNASDGSHAFAHIGHPYWVRALTWSPDGRWIASGYYDGTSGTGDGTVQVWPVE